MVKLGVGLGVVGIVLAIAAGAAFWGTTTLASSEDDTSEAVRTLAQTIDEGRDGDESGAHSQSGGARSGTAFLGIAGRDGSPDGAVVVAVLEDGPSAGALSKGDVITAIDGEAVTAFEDVVTAVESAQPGDEIELTIRGGSSVRVTLGNRPTALDESFIPSPGKWMDIDPPLGYAGKLLAEFGTLGALGDSFVRAEIVFETEDDGFKTISGVAGTISGIDESAGTFTLTPKDGSAPVNYQVETDTVVIPGGAGDISALDEDERTLVVQVDDDVSLVLQDDFDADPSKKMGASGAWSFGPGTMYGFGRGQGAWQMPAPQIPGSYLDPNGWNSFFEEMKRLSPGEAMDDEDFQRMLDELPEGIRQMIEEYLMEFDEWESNGMGSMEESGKRPAPADMDA